MNIYVANLNYQTEEGSLKTLFEEYGAVSSAKIITDKFNGRSKGFGFVEMPNDEEGQQAIDKLNNTEFEGKTISVAVAREREKKDFNRKPGNYNQGGNRGGNYNRR